MGPDLSYLYMVQDSEPLLRAYGLKGGYHERTFIVVRVALSLSLSLSLSVSGFGSDPVVGPRGP